MLPAGAWLKQREDCRTVFNRGQRGEGETDMSRTKEGVHQIREQRGLERVKRIDLKRPTRG